MTMQLKIFLTVLLFGLTYIQAKEVAKPGYLSDEVGGQKLVIEDNILAKGIVTIGDKQYYISPNTTLINALEALELCYDVGMKLVDLETEEEYALVSDYLHKNDLGTAFYWTGGRELVNVYMWTGLGRMVEYFKWDAGNPDRTDVYSCLAIRGSLGMNDVDCAALYSFICEYTC